MSELVPFAVAREFAIASKFNTLKEYSDFVVNQNLVGFPSTPKVYTEYTTAYEFLGKTVEEYKAGKFATAVANRDQKAMCAKIRATWAKKREANNTEPVQHILAPKVVESSSSNFTAEEVIDILVTSNASRLYIAEFIEQHKVNPVFAVETLLKLYKSELVEAG
jgi:hypothetical protein